MFTFLSWSKTGWMGYGHPSHKWESLKDWYWIPMNGLMTHPPIWTVLQVFNHGTYGKGCEHQTSWQMDVRTLKNCIVGFYKSPYLNGSYIYIVGLVTVGYAFLYTDASNLKPGKQVQDSPLTAHHLSKITQYLYDIVHNYVHYLTLWQFDMAGCKIAHKLS